MAAKKKIDLIASLALYHREKQLAPLRDTQKALAVTLDGLNAFGALEDLRRLRFSPRLCHGPSARDGLTPFPWVGAVIWHRPAGYLGYKTLTLIGVWAKAQDENGAHQIMIGTKRITFAAPFYDAEAYFKLIPKAFDLYYDDNGSPPDSPALVFVYDAKQRLEAREQIAAALAALA